MNPASLPLPHPTVRPGTPWQVMLVGNYEPDGQESMQRFAYALRDGLEEAGVTVEFIRPPVKLGRFARNHGHGAGKWLGYLDKFVLFPFHLRRRLRYAAAEAREQGRGLIVHVADHSNAAYCRSLGGFPSVLTCHDLLAVRSALGEIPENPTRWSGRVLQHLIHGSLRHASHVACVSSATRADLLRLTPLASSQVSLVPNSLNFDYHPLPAGEAALQLAPLRQRAGLDPDEPFILHVGGDQWYKNRPGVIRTHARLAAEMNPAPRLIMVGKPFDTRCQEALARHPRPDLVTPLSQATNEDLRALYSTATVFLFPSLSEGFGWPVAEAQACGCPVVCSRGEPFTEVSGGAASLCDPTDETALAAAIRELLTDEPLREQRRSEGLANAQRYQPAAMISGYLQSYQRARAEVLPAAK